MHKLTGQQKVYLYKLVNGEVFSDGETLKPYTLKFGKKSISCEDWEHNYDDNFATIERKIKFTELPTPHFHRGIDNSGGHYITLTWINDNLKYVQDYYGRTVQKLESVTIQVWDKDRSNPFISFEFHEKPYPGAKYYNLKHEMMIICLDQESTAELENMIKAYAN